MGLWFSSQVKLLNHDATHRNPQETSWYLPKGTSTSEIKWGGEGTMMLAAYCQHQFRFQMSLPEQINGTSDPRRPIFLYKGGLLSFHDCNMEVEHGLLEDCVPLHTGSFPLR